MRNGICQTAAPDAAYVKRTGYDGKVEVVTIQDLRQAHDLIHKLEEDIVAINSEFQVQCSVCMHEDYGAVLPGYICNDEEDMIRLLSAQIMNYAVGKEWDLDSVANFLDGLVKSVGVNYMTMNNQTQGLKS